jgi:hypothetical protein
MTARTRSVLRAGEYTLAGALLAGIVYAVILLSAGVAPAFGGSASTAYPPPGVDAGVVAVLDAPIAAPPVALAGSSSSSPPAPAPAPTLVPADKLHDPIEAPIAAIGDVRAAWREGWALGLLVALVIVARGLGTARRRWPASRLLSWLSGRTALVVLGVGTTGAAAVDAIALGGSWLAAAAAAAGALLALIEPGPGPKAGA